MFYSEHTVQSFEQFDKYRLCDEFCDIIFKVQSVSFRTHRMILAASSPYFYAMFTSGLMEETSDTITLHDIDVESFELLLQFMYTSKIDITESNAQDLFVAADMFQLTIVSDACVEFLQHQIDPANAIEMLYFAESHLCDKLG